MNMCTFRLVPIACLLIGVIIVYSRPHLQVTTARKAFQFLMRYSFHACRCTKVRFDFTCLRRSPRKLHGMVAEASKLRRNNIGQLHV